LGLTFGNPPRFAKGSCFEGDLSRHKIDYQQADEEYQFASLLYPPHNLALANLGGLPKLKGGNQA
jgi:hypothetical protein